MCYNVFAAHWAARHIRAHWDFSMCSAMCTSDNVFRNVFLAGFAMCPKHIDFQWASMCLQCFFNVFFCTLKHIETHWNTLKHIVVIVAQLHKNVPDYNVFQCVTMCLQWALKTHPMGSNVPPMFFQCVSCTLGYCPILNVQKTHWKNIGRHIDAHSMCF